MWHCEELAIIGLWEKWKAPRQQLRTRLLYESMTFFSLFFINSHTHGVASLKILLSVSQVSAATWYLLTDRFRCAFVKFSTPCRFINSPAHTKPCRRALWGYHLFAHSVSGSHGNQYGEELAHSNTQWPLCFLSNLWLSVDGSCPSLLHCFRHRLLYWMPNCPCDALTSRSLRCSCLGRKNSKWSWAFQSNDVTVE